MSAETDAMEPNRRDRLLRRLRRAFGVSQLAPTTPKLACEGCGDEIQADYGRDRCEKCVRDAARIAALELREEVRRG